MIRLFELETKSNKKYWFIPIHNRRVKLFTADKNLKKYMKVNNYERISSHVIKTDKSIDYLFIEGY